MSSWQTDYPPRTTEIQASIAESARLARRHFRDTEGVLRSFAMVIEPGDATHYEAFGVWRDKHTMLFGFMAGIEGGGSAAVPTDTWIHVDYLREITGLDNLHTARVAADFLNCLFGHIDKGTIGTESP